MIDQLAVGSLQFAIRLTRSRRRGAPSVSGQHLSDKRLTDRRVSYCYSTSTNCQLPTVNCQLPPSLCGSGAWEADDELGALVGLAGGGDGAAVMRDDRLADGQAQAMAG